MQKLPKTILCDIDGTIALPLLSDNPEVKYGDAVPVPSVIEQLRRARALGFRIVLYTARGMLTKDGSPDLAFEYAGKSTIAWLRKHDVPYDEIHWGKPTSCVIVDDLAVRPHEFKDWLNGYES